MDNSGIGNAGDLLKRWAEDPETKKQDLERFIKADEFRSRARRKNEMLKGALEGIDELHMLIADEKGYRLQVAKLLGKRQHTMNQWVNMDGQFSYEEEIFDPLKLTNTQFARIYVLLRQLGDCSPLANEIGAGIDRDLLDPYSEHGGLVAFEPGHGLRLKEVESELANEQDRKNNRLYTLPEGAERMAYLFKYHFHATSDDDSIIAGPSQGTKNAKDPKPEDNGDLHICYIDARNLGESHNLVMTKLAGSSFNIDYFGGVRRMHGASMTVVDLGNYSYTPDPRWQRKGLLERISGFLRL